MRPHFVPAARASAVVALTAMLACGPTESTLEECRCHLGQVCYQGACVTPRADGKSDLPNGALVDREHDGLGYGVIARYYQDHGYDVRADLTKLRAIWPVRSERTAAFNRFGTPARWGDVGYYHTGLDVFRADPTTESDEIIAPFAGDAMVFDWSGSPGYPGDSYYNGYDSVVALYDPESHAIIQFMHLRPVDALRAATSFVRVAQGDTLGRLAGPLTFLDSQHEARLRHSHVSLVDGANLLALNPARHLAYHDTVAPTAVSLYVLDADARKHDRLAAGPLDIVAEVYDRDNDSAHNFEVEILAFEMLAGDGTVIRAEPRCRFEDLIESVANTYSFRTLSLLDLGNAAAQVADSHWFGSDFDDLDRTFRYALTQFHVAPDGRCEVYDDAAGFVELPESVDRLRVRLWIWDQSDNTTAVEFVLGR